MGRKRRQMETIRARWSKRECSGRMRGFDLREMIRQDVFFSFSFFTPFVVRLNESRLYKFVF